MARQATAQAEQNQGPEEVSAQSSDEALRAALQSRPALLQTAQAAASRAYQGIMGSPYSRWLGVAEFWNNYVSQMGMTRPNPRPSFPAEYRASVDASVRQLRLTLDCRDVLAAILADLPHLTSGEQMALGRYIDAPGEMQRRVRAVMLAHPGLAAWQARRDAAAERGALAQQAGQAAINEQARLHREKTRTEAATVLLRRLAREGVTLTVDAGNLMARPVALLSRADRSELLECHDELTALLNEPAALVA